jgi:deoxyribodipyrimidine photolyase
VSSTPPVIVWFRQDLRVTDNPALTAAADTGYPVLPVYILDDASAGDWKMGAASRWWLHQSLNSLKESLGGHLRFLCGDASEILTQLAERQDAVGVYWDRCYEPWHIDRDRQIKVELKKKRSLDCEFQRLAAVRAAGRRKSRWPTSVSLECADTLELGRSATRARAGRIGAYADRSMVREYRKCVDSR